MDIRVSVGDVVEVGGAVAVVLSMKMEHLIQWSPADAGSDVRADEKAEKRYARVVDVVVEDQQVHAMGLCWFIGDDRNHICSMVVYVLTGS